MLIRHAPPAVDPQVPARAWSLSDQGREAAISSHGTVISLLVARRRGVDAHAFQQRLAMPDLVVIKA